MNPDGFTLIEIDFNSLVATLCVPYFLWLYVKEWARQSAEKARHAVEPKTTPPQKRDVAAPVATVDTCHRSVTNCVCDNCASRWRCACHKCRARVARGGRPEFVR